MTEFRVHSDRVEYGDNEIRAQYTYDSTRVVGRDVYPKREEFVIKTETTVPKLGVMLVGWGGNNGSTITAGVLANKHKLSWMTKEGEYKADYVGSLTQASTVKLGMDDEGTCVSFTLDCVTLCVPLSIYLCFSFAYSNSTPTLTPTSHPHTHTKARPCTSL